MNRRAKRLLEDLDQEIREHIELATQENMERGMPPVAISYTYDAMALAGIVFKSGREFCLPSIPSLPCHHDGSR